MKNIILMLCLTLSIGLTACTSIPIERVDGRVLAWKNTNIDDLIKYWGIPSKKQQINEKFYAEWLNEDNAPGNTSLSVGSGSYSGRSSLGVGISLFDLGSKNDACSRIVTYDGSGNVTDIGWKGTRDYCYELTPDLDEINKKQTEMEQK